MSATRLISFLIILILLVVSGYLFSSSDSLGVKATDCTGLSLYPSDSVVVLPAPGGVRTLSQVHLGPSVQVRPSQKFTLELYESDVKKGSIVKELPSLDGGVQTVFILDIDPEFVTSTPVKGRMDQTVTNDPAYYFAALWQAILAQFGFSSDWERSNFGRIVIPATLETSQQDFYDPDELYYYLLPRMPELATLDRAVAHEGAVEAVGNWLKQEGPRSRVIVLLRWQRTPFQTDRSYARLGAEALARPTPIIVIDIGQEVTLRGKPNRAEYGWYVVQLGPTPDKTGDLYPTPANSLLWEANREALKRYVADRLRETISQVMRSIGHRFLVDYTWPEVFDEKAASSATLLVKLNPEPNTSGSESVLQCQLPLRFPTTKISVGQGRRLYALSLGMIIAAGLIIPSIIYVLICWTPFLLDMLRRLWKTVKKAETESATKPDNHSGGANGG